MTSSMKLNTTKQPEISSQCVFESPPFISTTQLLASCINGTKSVTTANQQGGQSIGSFSFFLSSLQHQNTCFSSAMFMINDDKRETQAASSNGFSGASCCARAPDDKLNPKVVSLQREKGWQSSGKIHHF